MSMSRVFTTGAVVHKLICRNFGSSSVVLQQAKVDPIQKAFADKAREYVQKQKALGDQKLVDADDSVNKAYLEELERVNRYYQVKTQEEFTKFPPLQYDDVKLDTVDLHEQKPEDNLRW